VLLKPHHCHTFHHAAPLTACMHLTQKTTLSRWQLSCEGNEVVPLALARAAAGWSALAKPVGCWGRK
jgi:hypothetical protein